MCRSAPRAGARTSRRRLAGSGSLLGRRWDSADRGPAHTHDARQMPDAFAVRALPGDEASLILRKDRTSAELDPPRLRPDSPLASARPDQLAFELS